MIDIAHGIKPLPENSVTQTFAFIGRKGSGKTYGAGKLVEQMLEQGSQTVIFDPLGNWYGLRLSKSGKGSGYDIPILGGEHGDIPINEHSGRLIADLVVDHGISAIIDLSPFSKAKRKLFMADFCEHLFERKKLNRSPIHLVIEEAHLFAPQRVDPGSARMLGAMEDLVRLGRNFGVGVTMIDQRPQSVNKEVLNQVECLFTFQITGPHERKAIKDWVVYSGASSTEMVDELPSLKVGECFIWSPAWLGVLKKVRIKKKTTYDSTGTPTAGDTKQVEAKPLSDADLKAVRDKMADLIEEKEANDPTNLKRRIRELEKEISSKPAATIPDGYRSPDQVERIINDRDREWSTLIDQLNNRVKNAIQVELDQGVIHPTLIETIQRPDIVRHPTLGCVHPHTPSRPNGTLKTISRSAIISDSTIPKAQQKILDSIAWYLSIGIGKPSTSQIAIMANFSPSSSHTGNMLSKLVPTGYIERGSGDAWLTDAGLKVVAIPENQSLDQLHHFLLNLRCISGAPSQVLNYIILNTDRPGDELTTQEVAQGMGWSTISSHTGNMLSKLASIGLIERRNGMSRTTEIMYPKGLK